MKKKVSRKSKKKVKVEAKGFLYFAPRVLALIVGLFIFFFALFSGSEEVGLLKNSVNALPWLVFLVMVYFSWKSDSVGASFFLTFGLLTVWFFETWSDLIVFGIVSFPILLIGGLFLWNYYSGRK